ncbi:MAG TPA: hypothetical protein VJ810_01615, partial [Blastocatellia bacterium]|nr:hypothetical protein [Blastocatellia bacterium]
HHGYDKLLKLWFDQNGRCPQCGGKITRETGWHLHHWIWVVNGGDESIMIHRRFPHQRMCTITTTSNTSRQDLRRLEAMRRVAPD